MVSNAAYERAEGKQGKTKRKHLFQAYPVADPANDYEQARDGEVIGEHHPGYRGGSRVETMGNVG